MATAQEGRMVLSILDGLYRSSRGGREIRLTPARGVAVPAAIDGRPNNNGLHAPQLVVAST